MPPRAHAADLARRPGLARRYARTEVRRGGKLRNPVLPAEDHDTGSSPTSRCSDDEPVGGGVSSDTVGVSGRATARCEALVDAHLGVPRPTGSVVIGAWWRGREG